MSLSESSATRTDDSSGKNIKTFTDGDGDHIQAVACVDEDGDHLQIESWYDSSALEEANNIKASSGRLFYLRVVSTSSTDAWLQLFNEADSTPSTDPLHRVFVAAGEDAEIDLRLHGRSFDTGILFGLSSTAATYTAHGVDEFLVTAGYK